MMTPLTLTRLHNGDMTQQVFLKEVRYNINFPPDLLDPDRPLSKSSERSSKRRSQPVGAVRDPELDILTPP